MTTKSYSVTGMTCNHCARAVRGEVANVPGVASVDVDLATGAVTVAVESAIDDAAIAAAIDEAGYEVAV